MNVIKKTRSAYLSGDVATLSGTIKKSIALISVTIVSAIGANLFIPLGGPAVLIMGAASIGAFILALITCFKPSLAEYTSPGYAVFEGVALGLISTTFERYYYGITATAVTATFVVALLMLFLWKARIIVVTDKFRSILIGLTFGVMALYLIDFIASFFSVHLLPRAGIVGIGISVIIVAIAAFNLILDFDNIENSVYAGMPKYMEYFNAFGLLMTLVWLYVEILRLLQMLQSSDD